MQVNRYIFQSPYSSQVQFGTPDPSVKKEDETQSTQKETTDKGAQKTLTIPNESLQNAKNFTSAITKEVTPSVNNSLLDTYA